MCDTCASCSSLTSSSLCLYTFDSNQTTGWERIVLALGDRLLQLGQCQAAHVCYLVSYSTFGSPSQMRSHKTIELPLGDVWGYDLVDNAWEKITNSFGKVSSNWFGDGIRL